MGGDEMASERYQARTHSYEQVRARMLEYDSDNPMRQIMLLRTTDSAPRRVVEREAARLTEAARSLGMTCDSIPDPFMKAPEHIVVLCIEGTAGQMAALASFMIRA